MNEWLSDQVDQFSEETEPVIFWLSVATTTVLLGAFVLYPSASSSALTRLDNYIIQNLGWVYMVVVLVAVVAVVFLALGPWGRIKLGTEETEPEFTMPQFFAMMFSAGMAVGLVFWGPTEALVHYGTVPPLFDVPSESLQAMAPAVQYTFLHQGISPWATYLVFGVAIGYYTHRRGYPARPATMFTPLFGDDSLDSIWAKLLDAMVVVISVGGIVVSLGFGVVQFLAGASYVFGVNTGNLEIIGVTVGLTLVVTVIAAVPISLGIQRISDFNMTLFGLLLLTTILLAPISFIASISSEALAGYITDFFAMSLETTVGENGGWVGDWTMFFWAWWLAFGPMIGIFIARISKGRTIRQVVTIGIVGPITAAFPWFATLGGSALWIQSTGQADLLATYAEYGVEAIGFALFEELVPLSGVFSVLFLLLVLTFLITTVDSSIVSVSIQTVGGNQHPNVLNRVVWSLLISGLTGILIIIDGLDALQSFVVIVGFPIAIMTVVTIVALAVTLERRHPVILTERSSEASKGDSVTGNPAQTSADAAATDD